MSKMDFWVQIYHDPYGKNSLYRELVESKNTCSFCGSQRKTKKLFRYHRVPDSGNTRPIEGLFCSKLCADSYHGAKL